MTESPCDFHCGYYSSGRDLWEHVFWEHRDCTECEAKAPQPPYSLTHKLVCPRLQPGWVYPGPVPAEFDDDDDSRAEE